MQIAQENAAVGTIVNAGVLESEVVQRATTSDCKVIRRNGAVVGFEPSKIAVAMT